MNSSKLCDRRLAGAVLFTALTASPVLADDLIPPPWPRFSPGSTAQSWDFHAGPAGGAPDGGLAFNPWGTPNFTPANPANWLATFNGRNDVWAVNDFDPLTFDIPNDGPFPNDIKDLWLQITYLGTSPLTFGIQTASQFGPAVQVGAPIVTPLPGGWTHEASLWRFHGCPEKEIITITPPIPGTTIFIDQVVMDTSCYVPTPGGAPLLALAGLAARRRRR